MIAGIVEGEKTAGEVDRWSYLQNEMSFPEAIKRSRMPHHEGRFIMYV